MGAWGTGFVAAAVPGVVSAVVTRALMAAVAELTNDDSTFNPAGLLFIAFIYVLFLLPGCLALALSRAWWPWLVLGAGVVLLAFEAVAIGVQETADAHDMSQGQWVGLVLVLMAMFVTYAVQVVVSARWARRGLGRTSTVTAQEPDHVP